MKKNPKKNKTDRRKRATKFGITNPNGNRHQRRAEIAFARKIPMLERQSRIEKSIKQTKEEGRIAKQKHIDLIKSSKKK